MTSPAVSSNIPADLSRIRDNQRKSRARRKEYFQELEQRLRVYELQGIEASAEVQKSARKVFDKNKQLRELLNKHGVTDAYILQYLQRPTVSTPESSLDQMMQAGAGEVATQLQQQLMLPKQAAYLEKSILFEGPRQSNHSISVISTTHSPGWEPSQSTMAYSHHAQQLGVCPPERHHYSPSVFLTQPAPTQLNPFQSSCPGHMTSDSSHGLAKSEPMPGDSRPAVNNKSPMDPCKDLGN
ncbi:hypothetical protein VFPPC_11837 [Pochonia chlamydosporia 170]|uniref:BZIP domain-containing protein n=1 Tax=Pochonia chlamydosporia 170 TaxID=1380566 RepID=A0A179EYN5_METCM|nr:hypothetical protein VFPPC_11837 [Pochonia chlamydosporia 170]OAQ57943.2 hypothetical protein VFPPC_11837 [Pochonia chlamydosporia 170]